MKDDQGDPLTDAKLLDRVSETGALVVVREAVESTDFANWRRELRRSARARGFRISVLRRERFVVVRNPDHVVTEQQRRAAFVAMSESFTALSTPEPADRPRRPTLRAVGRDVVSRSKSTPPV